MSDAFTYKRLQEWARLLAAEGSDLGSRLTEYGKAWQAQVDRLRALLLRYGQHQRSCPERDEPFRGWVRHCDCGWDEVMSAAEAVGGER